jgi:hypothetical protein
MIESKKRLFILLGIAGALVLVALVLPKVLFAGGGDDVGADLSAPIVPAGATATPVAPVPTGAPADAEPASTFEVFSTKNPFTPLVASEAEVAEQPTVTVPVLGDVPAPSTLPTSLPTFPTAFPTFPTTPAPAPSAPVVTAPPASAPTPAPAAPQPREPQRIAVQDVFYAPNGAARVLVRVNETSYDVGEGDRFATSYQVVELGVDPGCAQFLFGDERFRVCEGEALLK